MINSDLNIIYNIVDHGIMKLLLDENVNELEMRLIETSIYYMISDFKFDWIKI